MAEDGPAPPVLWISLGSVAAFLLGILFTLFVFFDARTDALSAWQRRLCNQNRLLDQVYCDALQKIELRQLGSASTLCPLRIHYPQAMRCPEMPETDEADGLLGGS